MPGLVRKLFIYATAQGLLLQPLGNKNQSTNSLPTTIEWKSHAITSSLNQNDDAKGREPLEVHGILGLLRLSTNAYLIVITRRQEVAQVRGKAVYVVTDVALVPLSSQSDAQASIDQARASSRSKRSAASDTETDDETDDGNSTVGTEDGFDTSPPNPVEAPGTAEASKGIGLLAKGTSVAADVIKDRGKYGRFAERWFSKGGWTANGRETLGMSRSQDDLTREQKRQGLESLPDAENKPATTESADAANNDRKVLQDETPSTDVSASEQLPPSDIVKSITPRIVYTLRVFLSSRSFYFSYDHDLSKRLAVQDHGTTTLPLYKRFDPLYFWNQHLLEPLIASEQHSLILPVIQGFVGQRAFTIGKTPSNEPDKIVDTRETPGEVMELADRPVSNTDAVPSAEVGPSASQAEAYDFLLTIISRRSIKRAGLRYLRRGVDDAGNVANNVETEQILSDQQWDPAAKVSSLVQVRGSIPLFFSQSPYSFKPVPITYGSEATNHQAFDKHFSKMLATYGKVQIASLVDKHGTEKPIGELYQHHVDLTNEGQLPSQGFPEKSKLDSKAPLAFTWFDFHHECRAMNFQNVSVLLDGLSPSLSDFRWTEAESNRVTQKQNGIVRTNCMDCLDRTNVVQSAIAGKIFQEQLSTYGLSIDLSSDPKTQWFNTLWADNGDAISRQYAGTAALKGDFTRTRKRNWTGAINDFSLTLGRYYNNILRDYFLQTIIDYVQGLSDERIWEEFESDMMSSDYALDMSRVRQGAIERCVKVILGHGINDASEEQDNEADDKASPPTKAGGEPAKSVSFNHDDEDLISGWTLQTPALSNTLRSQPMEECVVLLTDAAIYAVRFDWNTEKVGSYERIPLADMTAIKRGVYITSTLGAKNVDEERNVGFVVSYKSSKGGDKRVNTRSLSSSVAVANAVKQDKEEPPAAEQAGSAETAPKSSTQDFASQTPADVSKTLGETPAEAEPQTMRLLAFKSLSPRATAVATTEQDSKTSSPRIGAPSPRSRSGGKVTTMQALRSTHDGAAEVSERDTVKDMTDDIWRAVAKVQQTNAGGKEAGSEEESMWTVSEGEIVSLPEAKKATGYLESLGYSLRRLVWA